MVWEETMFFSYTRLGRKTGAAVLQRGDGQLSGSAQGLHRGSDASEAFAQIHRHLGVIYSKIPDGVGRRAFGRWSWWRRSMERRAILRRRPITLVHVLKLWQVCNLPGSALMEKQSYSCDGFGHLLKRRSANVLVCRLASCKLLRT